MTLILMTSTMTMTLTILLFIMTLLTLGLDQVLDGLHQDHHGFDLD